jgi:hypothetical protein
MGSEITPVVQLLYGVLKRTCPYPDTEITHPTYFQRSTTDNEHQINYIARIE